jgi:hypothetical protein
MSLRSAAAGAVPATNGARGRSAAQHNRSHEHLHPGGYAAHAERAMLISIEAFDWNCSQHITARFTETEVAAHFAVLRARIAELEMDVAGLRGAR